MNTSRSGHPNALERALDKAIAIPAALIEERVARMRRDRPGADTAEIAGMPSTRAGALGPVSRPLSSPAGEGTATGVTFAGSAKGPKGSIRFTHPIVE